ncbi:MAG: thiamine phosphate synthase [Methylocystaceae bacterium]|nr:thiamine phosphate synthase [Methylocystaceae bacterium]
MRHTVSELAQRLNRLHAPSEKFPSLLLMTDAKRLPDPRALIPLLPSGSAVIIRHFNDPQKEQIIRKIILLCRKHHVKIFVSDSLSLALKYKLDGIHYSEKKVRLMASCGRAKRPYKKMIFTCACHSESARIAASKAKMDAILLSPAFPTQSHPGAKSLGIWQIASLSRHSSLQTYGLGGINQKTAHRLSSTQLCGFAGISGLI